MTDIAFAPNGALYGLSFTDLYSINTQTASVTTGTSLMYTENFNEFKDLLRSTRDKRRKELEQNPPPEEKEVKKKN